MHGGAAMRVGPTRVGATCVAAWLAASSGCGGKTSLGDFDLVDASPETSDPNEQLPDATFLIPYRRPPTPDRAIIAVELALQRIDLTIVMDTTGSMQPSIENLKSNLTTHILPAVQRAVPSIGIALVDHKDYPLSPYGGNGDYPVRIAHVVTTDVAQAQSAVTALMADGGGDEPESQISAMFHALTGEGLRWEGKAIPQRPPVPGRSGGVDFRPGSLPLLVEITDADWHDVDNVPYDARVFAPPTLRRLADAFVALGAKFIDVTNGATESPETQANALSDRTHSSVAAEAFGDRCGGGCCTGIDGAARKSLSPDGRCRLNFLHADGAGVSDSIVEAVRALAVGSVVDVAAFASNATTNPNGVDATKFIRALRAIEEGEATRGCAAHLAEDRDGDGVKDTFVAVRLGTRVCFEVLPRQNDTIVDTSAPQLFDAWIDVQAEPGAVELDRRLVRFEVPPSPRTR